MAESKAALSSFAMQVLALKRGREDTLPEKVGAMVPTYRRPDLARSCVLQLLAQSRKPDVICVHQNGNEESYEWAVRDLDAGTTRIVWLHTPAQLPQHEWYAVPLENLLEKDCT